MASLKRITMTAACTLALAACGGDDGDADDGVGLPPLLGSAPAIALPLDNRTGEVNAAPFVDLPFRRIDRSGIPAPAGGLFRFLPPLAHLRFEDDTTRLSGGRLRFAVQGGQPACIYGDNDRAPARRPCRITLRPVDGGHQVELDLGGTAYLAREPSVRVGRPLTVGVNARFDQDGRDVVLVNGRLALTGGDGQAGPLAVLPFMFHRFEVASHAGTTFEFLPLGLPWLTPSPDSQAAFLAVVHGAGYVLLGVAAFGTEDGAPVCTLRIQRSTAPPGVAPAGGTVRIAPCPVTPG